MAKGKQLKALISIAGKVDPSLQKSLKEAQKQTSGLGKGLKVTGAVVAAATAAVTAGAVAATKALYNLGESFESAENTIRVGTGATGEALDDLYASMEEVYKSVPTTLDDASSVIADYNTRLGLTGDTLESMSTQALQVADLLGEDVSSVVEQSSKAFEQWGVSADDMSDSMDYIFKVSQSTGMGFNDLMSSLQSSGVTLQDLGYSFEESAAMIGSLDKAGINSSTVMNAMKKAMSSVAETGGDVQTSMAEVINKVQSASTTTDALAIASEVFGSKAGPTMVQAIQAGALSAEDLTEQLEASGESLQAASEDTYTFSDKMQLLKQNAEVALEPIASGFVDIANDAMPYITEAFNAVVPEIQSFASMLMPVVQSLLPEAAKIVEKIFPVITQIASMVMPALTSVIASVYGIMESLMPVFEELINSILPVVQQMISSIMPLVSQVMSYISPIISMVAQLISSLLPPLVSIINTLMPILDTVIGLIGTGLSLAFQVLTPVINGIITLVSGIANTFATAFAAAVGAVKGPINTIIGMVNGIISSINGVGFTIPEWVPVVGGKGFSISLPSIPMLATGGFTDGVSIAGEAGTEAVISFDDAYRDQNLSYWAQAGERLGVDADGIDALVSGGSSSTTEYNLGGVTFSPNVSINGNATESDVLSAIRAAEPEFFDMLEEWLDGRRRGAYGASY